ncbi:serine/threonine-protein kinase [Streptomyces sp. SID8499]|uniref:serine/threonine-protein kinase n=1 Tax=Streptomyces sp. SID8499 TaxID=2706106 RepID=UPI0013CD1A92|nr:serine/threonine-protein kinase [Streptomyces sp. SID8499]NED37385.1 protein kinase [Streptomyces sp. SID8499]
MKPLDVGDPIRLGPYRLLGVLGEGGMGKVYLGRDGSGLVVAVKVLRPELAHDPGLAQRFVREAIAAQAVRSPGVANVLAAQTEIGRPWIATEFLTGPTLEEAVERHGPFDGNGVRALAASIARTLGDIHAAGFVHRDLKPQNIILTGRGPRVIDFGIARPEHGLTLTTTGQIPVTPGYGAPEQVLGRRVTPAADVFSLGAVLVYAATGRRAFEGAHLAAVQYEVVHGEPRWDGLAPELHALIAPCLAKDAAARPDPRGIVAASGASGSGRVWRRGPLAQEIKEREARTRRLTAPDATDAPALTTRRRVLTGFAAGGALLAAGGGTTGWWLLGQRGSRPKPDPFAVPPAVKTPQARLLLADDGDFIIGESVKALWTLPLVAHQDSAAPLPVRDVVVLGAARGGIAAYNVVDGGLRWEARGMLPGHYLSLDDRLVAAIDAEGTLRTFVPSTGEAKWTARADAAALLAADRDAVYVVTKDGRLRSVRRSDATIGWTAPVADTYRGKLTPPGAVGGGRLVLPTSEGHVLAVSTSDGRLAWERRWQAIEVGIRPVVQDGVVYLNGRTLTARRVADGREIWSRSATDIYKKPVEWGPASIHTGSVYAAAGDRPERSRAGDGHTVWTSWEPGDNTAPVLVQGNGVWMIDEKLNGEVNTVNVETGQQAWTFPLPAKEGNTLAVDGNRAFLRSGASLCALPVF